MNTSKDFWMICCFILALPMLINVAALLYCTSKCCSHGRKKRTSTADDIVIDEIDI